MECLDWGGGVPIVTQDLSGNYWGTTDTTQLDEWIYDRNDDEVVNFVYVDYLPIAEVPIKTESMSFGSFKALYGGQE